MFNSLPLLRLVDKCLQYVIISSTAFAEMSMTFSERWLINVFFAAMKVMLSKSCCMCLCGTALGDNLVKSSITKSGHVIINA